MLFVEEDKYDMIIRTRWDVAFNPLEDWQGHVRETYLTNSILGFKSLAGTVIERYQTLFDGRDISELDPEFKSLANVSWPLDDPLKPSPEAPYFLHSLVQDFCIMYPPKAFDSGKAIQLYHDQKLLGCEFGWAQILLQCNEYRYQWQNRQGAVYKIWGSRNDSQIDYK